MRKKALVFAMSVLLASPAAFAETSPHAPALPQIPDHHFKITDHGAVADNKTDSAKAIQETIKAAADAGGGIVDIPAGDYLSGPIELANNIDLNLAAGATVKLLPIDRYPGGKQGGKAFITAQDLHDIAITGHGTIDGQGAAWWPFAKTDRTVRRPRMIAMGSCDRILIDGVKLENSPMFHIAIGGHSTNVTVRGVTIRAPASTDPTNPSHNTDACDVSGSHVLVENCDVSVGDDDFTCGGGTSDVHIIHCTYGNGHGVSIGSYTNKGGVSDITVEDCTFTNTEAGIRIKSDRDRGGVVQNMTYRNLKMENVGIPILIYGAYMAKEPQYRKLTDITPEIAATYPAKPMGTSTPVFRNFTFSNITATVAKGGRAGLIWGLPEAPASNIVLENVKITADKPFGIFDANDVKIENCKIVTPAGDNKFATSNAKLTITP